MSWYLQALRKYATFEGRARRKEYWMFSLVSIVIVVTLGFAEGLVGAALGTETGVLGTIYWFAVLLPSVAVGVRRMHDTNHSGWWVIVPLVNLVFSLQDGNRLTNRFGPDPKHATP